MLNEDYEVELLKKLPVYHRKIYEFQQIANVETPELENLLVATDFVLDSWFVETATEYGIARQEKIAGLTPDPADDLETRRYKLLAKYTEKVPYTDETLEERLTSLCGGKDKYKILRDYLNYKISIETYLTDRGSYDEVVKALLKMLPCNLVLQISNIIKAYKETKMYVATGVSVAMRYTITHDLKLSDALRMDLVNAVALASTDRKHITNDIKESEKLSLELYESTAVAKTTAQLITNDVAVKDTVNGNSTMATPVSTARVITIK